MNETWVPVPGYERYYEVSDYGRVRSLDRLVPNRSGTRISRGRVLQPIFDKLGYPYVHLMVARRGRRVGSHQLVLLAFVGPRPSGMVARHLNGDAGDPRLTNLAYGTQSENNRDAVQHGTNGNTRKTHCARGHEFAGANVRHVLTATGERRYCRACQRENSQRYKARKQAA